MAKVNGAESVSKIVSDLLSPPEVVAFNPANTPIEKALAKKTEPKAKMIEGKGSPVEIPTEMPADKSTEMTVTTEGSKEGGIKDDN